MGTRTLLFADSHVHLDDDAFADDRDQVIARGRAAGAALLVVPAVDAASWPTIHRLTSRYANTHAAYGLHPLMLDQHQEWHLHQLSAWLDKHRAVAVGEIGLDFFVHGLDPERQRRLFRAQLAIAREHNLPVIVHARRAVEEIVYTLRQYPGLRGVVHSYTGSAEQARQLWGMGFFIGLGGPVTYPRAQRLQRLAAQMPLEWLLLESDAPDQPDIHHRGQRNEPARVVETLETIARLRGEEASLVAAITLANTRRLFGLDSTLATVGTL